MTTTEIIQAYYAAFNAGDTDAMLALVSDDVAHDVNEGKRRIGKDNFASFCTHMSHTYRETLTDIVVMAESNRAAAEFVVNGEYLQTDEGLPEAKGQIYQLPAGGFFDVENDKITRVTTYYNLNEWMAQVVG